MVVKHREHFETDKFKRQMIAVGVFAGFATILLGWILLFLGVAFEGWGLIFLGLLVALAIFSVLRIFIEKSEPEHVKALYSHQIFEMANATLPHLRTGLNEKSAGEVARILIKNTDAMAIALTNLVTVLAFSGVGEDHHKAGAPILTEATKEALKHDELRILESKDEIGCPVSDCPLSAAIVVPLETRGVVAGTLKFYYPDKKELTESRITLAEGLAKLLSIQLELSEIDKQEELTYKAELKALQAQINPHFLFNTLNTIASLCRTDSKKARMLIIQFADFFRRSLERESDFVTLEEEIDYVNSYLLFEKARFGQSLNIIEEIDKKALGVKMPALIIQPLVENAVKYGGTLGGHIKVKISAQTHDSEVTIQVWNNGKGMKKDEKGEILFSGLGKGMGIGLSNVNERLKSLYGEEFSLDIQSIKDKGTRVTVRIPILGGSHEAKSADS